MTAGDRIRELEAELVALEAQLLQAQKMEPLGQLAGSVAHDFNNLLVAIRGYAELLLAESSGMAAERATEILKAADQASSLTRQLLAFSRQAAGAPRPLDLNELVGECVHMFRRLLGPRIELTFQPAGRVAVARGDPGQLQQVLLNLVVNARDAMPGGGRIAIEVSARRIASGQAGGSADALPGEYVVVSVADTGGGIAPETKVHMFEPFFTTKPPGEGTGLGLATAYGVVRQHGGFITVDSVPGAGATFAIHLPASAERPAAARAAPARPPRGMGEAIVLVESEPTVRRLVQQMLEQNGHLAFATGDPDEALAHLAGGADCDLLITDLSLPTLSATELIDAARELRPHLSVLLMSGLFLDAGPLSGIPFIAKPFAIGELLAKVRQALDTTPS